MKEAWRVLSFPAIATADERFDIVTPYGPRTYFRREGDILHPARESRETLEHLRATMGSASFAAQYQQAPTPREGLLVKAIWFPRYSPANLPKTFDKVIVSCDTANKISDLSDYTAITVWGTRRRHAYLLHVVRQRMEYPELKRAIKKIALLHGATAILIEDKASGTQLSQELKREGLHAVIACAPDGDKQMRLNAQTAMMEAGMVHLPEDAAWLGDYLQEMTSFPNGRHDDQVDSTSQALAWLNKPNSGDDWIEFMEQEAKRRSGQDKPEVVMIAPKGVNVLFGRDGQARTIPEDRRISVPQDDVAGLIRAGWTRA